MILYYKKVIQKKGFDTKIEMLPKEEYSKVDSVELSRIVTRKNKNESDDIIKKYYKWQITVQ